MKSCSYFGYLCTCVASLCVWFSTDVFACACTLIALLEDERTAIIRSDRFQEFFRRAALHVERALAQPDVTVDYFHEDRTKSCVFCRFYVYMLSRGHASLCLAGALTLFFLSLFFLRHVRIRYFMNSFAMPLRTSSVYSLRLM